MSFDASLLSAPLGNQFVGIVRLAIAAELLLLSFPEMTIAKLILFAAYGSGL